MKRYDDKKKDKCINPNVKIKFIYLVLLQNEKPTSVLSFSDDSVLSEFSISKWLLKMAIKIFNFILSHELSPKYNHYCFTFQFFVSSLIFK